MKLKLVESAQPIDKLENNIARNVLPVFRDIEIDFSSKPTKLNMWGNVYLGTYFTNRKVAKLYLYTSAVEIDVWNEDNSDEFVADLFAILTIGLKKIPLGCISSKDPKSVEFVLDNADINKEFIEIQQGKEENPTPKEEKILAPKTLGMGYEPMSKEDWEKEYNRLQNETDVIREKLRSIENKVLDKELQTNEEYRRLKDEYEKTGNNEEKVHDMELNIIRKALQSNEEYNSLQKELQQKNRFIHTTFIQKIYPLMKV